MSIKKAVEEFKQKNGGNSSFSQKEMIMYLVSKVDTIHEKIEDGAGKIAANRTSIKGISTVLKISVTVLSGIIGFIFLLILR